MLHFIAKPLKGKRGKLLAQLEEKLCAAGAAYDLSVTSRKGEAGELAERFSREENPTVVAVGGDGTLNDVVCRMDPARCKLGLIPAGTGNDFAAAAKIPNGLAALDLILGGTPKQTDYIQFSNGMRSINIAGIGIDVDILLRCERSRLFTARSKYFISLLASLMKYRGCKMTIRANGREVSGKYLIAAVCSGRQFGGGIPINPSAVLDDGKLELVYVDCPKPLGIPRALVKLMQGKLQSLSIAHFEQTEEAEFIPEKEEIAQYDGELFSSPAFKAALKRDLLMYRG